MLSKRTWAAIILFGFLGSLAWGVENQFFNTFVYNNITPDPRPISWMVAASAITATLASVFIGALSDHLRYRWDVIPFCFSDIWAGELPPLFFQPRLTFIQLVLRSLWPFSLIAS